LLMSYLQLISLLYYSLWFDVPDESCVGKKDWALLQDSFLLYRLRIQ
jgi:hypothetical protein